MQANHVSVNYYSTDGFVRFGSAGKVILLMMTFQMAKTAIHRDNVEDKRNGTHPVAVSASMYENEASMPL
jgi:hypothetical protein